MNIKSNLKKLNSGNIPTTSNLSDGEMVFGKVTNDNQYHIFGNNNGVINDYSNFVKPPTDNTKLMAIYNSVWGDIAPSPAVVNSGNYRELYVNNKWSLDTSKRDGSWAFPFPDLQQAIDSIVPVSSANPYNVVIYVASGTYASNITIDKANITIICAGQSNSINTTDPSITTNYRMYPTIFTGLITLDVNSRNVRLVNMQVSANTVSMKSGFGFIYFDNCNFDYCVVTNPASGYYRFTNCSFNKFEMLAPFGQTEIINSTVNVVNSATATNGYYRVHGGKLTCINCRSINILQTGGTYISRGSTTYDGHSSVVGTDIGISSSAGILLLLEGSMYNGSQTFAKINKTGTGNYEISPSFIYDRATTILTGNNVTPINSMITHNYAGQVKVNYTGLTTTGFTNGVIKRLEIENTTPSVVASPTTIWPYGNTGNYNTEFFIAGAIPATTGRLRENNQLGQIHRWRITGTYANKGSGNNGQLQLRLRNPDSGFIITAENTMASGLTGGDFTVELTTIADNASLAVGRGYIIEVVSSFTDSNLVFTITNIVRDSEAIEMK